METGAFTEYVDVAQVVLYGFWIFFAFLILYLRREDKREGYPLESDRSDNVKVQGFPAIPKPKVFALPDGGTYEAPNDEVDRREILAEPVAPWPGAPLEPTGDPMKAGVGPGSWAERSDEPEVTVHGELRIVPMRSDPSYVVESRDPDPRDMEVTGADGAVAGSVSDIWVDRSEPQVRYLEVAIGGEARVLLPITMARVDGSRGQVKVASILASQFEGVPRLAHPDRITPTEEDRICAYYASGHMYATPERQESLF